MKTHTNHENQIVIGVAWWRPEQWQRLHDISQDSSLLEESYDDWLASAENLLREVRSGHVLERVDVDVEQLLAWCNENGLPVNSQSRARYVSDFLRTRDLR